jgi:thioredoxin reductase
MVPFQRQESSALGRWNSAATAILYLSGVVGRWWLSIVDTLSGPKKHCERYRRKKNVQVLWNTEVCEILGENVIKVVLFDNEKGRQGIGG